MARIIPKSKHIPPIILMVLSSNSRMYDINVLNLEGYRNGMTPSTIKTTERIAMISLYVSILSFL